MDGQNIPIFGNLGAMTPYTQMMFRQAQEPVPGMLERGGPNLGYASKGSTALGYVSMLFDTAKKERLMQQVQKESAHMQSVNDYISFLNTQASMPGLTDEARKVLIEDGYRKLAAAGKSELPKGEKGGLWQKVKEGIGQVLGDRPMPKGLDLYTEIGQTSALLDKQAHPEFYKDYWVEKANAALATAKGELKQAYGEYYPPALLNAKLAPVYSMLAEKAGAEYAQRFQATALGGVLTPEQALSAEESRQLLPWIRQMGDVSGAPPAPRQEPDARALLFQQGETPPTVAAPTVGGIPADMPYFVEAYLEKQGRIPKRDTGWTAVPMDGEGGWIDADKIGGVTVKAGTREPIEGPEKYKILKTGTASLSAGGQRSRLQVKEDGVLYSEVAPNNWQPVPDVDPSGKIKVDTEGNPQHFRPRAAPMWIETPEGPVQITTPGRALTTPGAGPPAPRLTAAQEIEEKRLANTTRIADEALRWGQTRPSEPGYINYEVAKYRVQQRSDIDAETKRNALAMIEKMYEQAAGTTPMAMEYRGRQTSDFKKWKAAQPSATPTPPSVTYRKPR